MEKGQRSSLGRGHGPQVGWRSGADGTEREKRSSSVPTEGGPNQQGANFCSKTLRSSGIDATGSAEDGSRVGAETGPSLYLTSAARQVPIQTS